jgi:hypothetical protein
MGFVVLFSGWHQVEDRSWAERRKGECWSWRRNEARPEARQSIQNGKEITLAPQTGKEDTTLISDAIKLERTFLCSERLEFSTMAITFDRSLEWKRLPASQWVCVNCTFANFYRVFLCFMLVKFSVLLSLTASFSWFSRHFTIKQMIMMMWSWIFSFAAKEAVWFVAFLAFLITFNSRLGWNLMPCNHELHMTVE